jgi:hypothetical protein
LPGLTRKSIETRAAGESPPFCMAQFGAAVPF